jgi:hypothetical protein
MKIELINEWKKKPLLWDLFRIGYTGVLGWSVSITVLGLGVGIYKPYGKEIKFDTL